MHEKAKIPQSGSIAAGFPSFADDYASESLDINELLVPHPNSSFFMRYTGSHVVSEGIMTGDILIVDRSVTPTQGVLVVSIDNGSMQLTRKPAREIWGVVTGMARKL